MKKRIFGIMLSLVLVASMLAGCGSSSKEPNEVDSKKAEPTAKPIKINEGATDDLEVKGDYNGQEITVFIFAQDHEKQVYQTIIDKFTESTGCKVNLEVTTADEYAAKLMAYKVASDLPDIFYVGPDSVASNANEGYILALDKYVPQETVADLWPAIVSAYRYNGSITGEGSLYCLPKDLSTFAFAYNKDLFDAAGVPYPDPAKPYSWEEFVDVCKKLTIDKNGDGEIDQWGVANALQWALDSFIYTNGATYLNEDYTKVMVDSPEFVQAFQYFADLTCNYKITPTVEQDTALGGYQRWLDGQVAFYACGTWDVGAFMDKNTFPYKWGLCGWPTGSTGVSMTRNGSVGFAVSAKTEHPEASAALITLLSTDLEGQRVLSGETTGASLQLPNIMSYAKGDFLNAVKGGKVPYGDNIEVIYNYIEGTEKYKGLFVETTYTYNNEWWTTFLKGGYEKVLNGEMTAKEYCEQIKPSMQTALDDANAQKADAQGN